MLDIEMEGLLASILDEEIQRDEFYLMKDFEQYRALLFIIYNIIINMDIICNLNQFNFSQNFQNTN